MKYFFFSCMLLLSTTLLFPEITSADINNRGWVNKLSLHGFGGWVYGKTNNENKYSYGGWDSEGHGNHFNFSLNIRAEISKNLTCYLQPSFNEHDGDKDTGVDYVFADWYLSDHLSLRAGKIKIPFMLMNEIHDVGTVRPFFLLPTGIYEDFGTESYQGFGVTGIFFPSIRNEWQITYDIYGGFIDLHDYVNKEQQTVTRVSLDNLLGGRLLVAPPVEGLRFGISVGRGEIKISEGPKGYMPSSFSFGYGYMLGGSIEYLNDNWEFRSEYLKYRRDGEDHSYYAELAYRLNDHWQAAVRYEQEDFFSQDELPTMSESKEFTLGLNYWVRPNLVVKASVTFIQGNLHTLPEEDSGYWDEYDPQHLHEETILGLFGVQFSF